MIRFKAFYCLGLWLALTLISCADLRQKEQLKAMGKLMSTLDSLDRVVVENYPDTMNKVRMQMMFTETALKNKLVLDTMYREYAADMNAYKEARKSIGQLNKHFVEMKAALKKERKQLRTLKKDIENGWGKRDRYTKYIHLEAKNLRVLANKSTELQQHSVTICDAYRLLHPKMVVLLEKLEQ